MLDLLQSKEAGLAKTGRATMSLLVSDCAGIRSIEQLQPLLSAQLFAEGMSRHTPGLHLTGEIDFSILLMGLKASPNLGSCTEIAVQCPDK